MGKASINGNSTPGTVKVNRSVPAIIHPVDDTNSDEYYYLSNLDQNIAVIMKTVHLYKPTEKSCDGIFSVLKESLSKVLVHYYPYAGSLTISQEGKLIVKNDGHGVPFVEAETDCELAALGVMSIPDPDKFGELIYVDPTAKNILEMPLLSVQITRFKCGGFSVGLAVNHCMSDGISAVQFLHSWAETARGLPLSISPFIERSIQKARQPPKIEFAHHEFTEIEDISDIAGLYKKEPIEYNAFTFDEKLLSRLKQIVMEDGIVENCTSFVALTAFIWSARTQALQMSPDQQTKLLFSIDGRSRVKPPLPKGFWGNAIVLACCMCRAEELVNKPLSSAVRQIQEAIEMTHDAFIRSAIDYIEITRATASLAATLLVTSWTRLGFNSSDFGWGDAFYSVSAELPEKGGCGVSTSSKG
ncbi:omega-hydroxypalmitate O-feruloyl transferase-like protein [Carex littledalei]|uniref:Omega-hydroxypalmitate O-feruloyl transferase-like protein n=1 Tax=Carex littledalei TaxID=544730 RepID=A0A833QXU5_9POAL|nr:omega-hydroxypalmitate O-feruloyl transferase-like protein [Carex littledalei]